MFLIEIKTLCLSGGKLMSKLSIDQNQYAQKFGLPLIHVEHLSRVIETRAKKTTILDDVTFTIPSQSLFAINGPSGSGKSTLLNMLTGIDRPSNGRIVFAGVFFLMIQQPPISPPFPTRRSSD